MQDQRQHDVICRSHSWPAPSRPSGVAPAAARRRFGRRQRRPVPARRRWLRRQRLAARKQEPELPVGGVKSHPKALFIRRTVVEATQKHQILQPRVAAVGPMHDVVGVAAAGVAAGNWHWLRSRSSSARRRAGRDRARPAPDVEDLAVGAVAQRHQAGIAGDAARRLPAQMEPPGLVDDRLTGVQVRGLRRRFTGAFAHLARFRGNVGRAPARRTSDIGSRRADRVPTTGLRAAHLARFRGNVWRAGRARCRANGRRCNDRLAGGQSVRWHVHRHREAVARVAGIRLHRAQQHRAHLGGQPRAQHQHAVFVHLRGAACGSPSGPARHPPARRGPPAASRAPSAPPARRWSRRRPPATAPRCPARQSGSRRGLSNRRSCRTPWPPRCGSARPARRLRAASSRAVPRSRPVR